MTTGVQPATSAAVSVVSCSSVGSLDRGQAVGLPADGLLEQVAHEAGVAEATGARLGLDDGPQGLAARLVEVIAQVAAHPLEDLDELVRV